jgi:adenylate cyclase
MAADVVGYSKLMGEDEARTLAALTALRQDLFAPVVATYGGTVVKRLGDGWIVEFGSVSDAVAGAIKVQEGLSDQQTIQLRIGVHIGDVTFQNEDIYGDGVNIAARLEALAKPGQILISDTAHHSLDGKGAAGFGGGDLHNLKNITRPVAIWHWPVDAEYPSPPMPEADFRDKPSIAVLPFVNMSDERDQSFFADGISEDIITELSRFKTLLVVARNASFLYKDTSEGMTEIGRNLGVRYLVEGSVRKSGQRIRVAAQLIDAESGHHVWANRFDGVLEDIFEMQDQVTMAIAGAVGVSIDKHEKERLRRQRPENMAAWELVLQASFLIFTGHEENSRRGAELCRQAIALDPGYARAKALLAMNHWTAAFLGWTKTGRQTLEEALVHAQSAYAIDQNEPTASVAMALCQLSLGDMDKALESGRRAIAIAPCSLDGRRTLAMVLAFKGELQAALEQLDIVAMLAPGDHFSFVDFLARANARFAAEEYEAACRHSESARELRPDWVGVYWVYAAAAALSGQRELAERLVRTATALAPRACLRFIRRAPMFTQKQVIEKLIEGLRLAGLPE